MQIPACYSTGNKQVYQTFGDNNEIVMENHNKYTKVCQVQYPRDSGEWCPDSTMQPDTLPKSPTNLVHKAQKGQKRWAKLPKPVEVRYSLCHKLVLLGTV